jgi:hypothetical protein
MILGKESVDSPPMIMFSWLIIAGGVQFTPEHKATLLKYFNEYGMTSTHRRNTELMEKCANEIGTTVGRVKVCSG